MSIEEGIKETQEQGNNSRPWLYKKGQSGNPGGRPKGKSLKAYSKNFLACMTDEERETFMEGLPKEIIWRMAEGNPTDQVDVKADLTINIESEVAEKYSIKENVNTNTETSPQGQPPIQSA